MRVGLGVGLTMLAISAAVAACEHEAQRDATANAARAPYFESAAERSAESGQSPPSTPLDRTRPAVDGDDSANAGHSDRFLWDDRATIDEPDGGVDAGGPDASPEPG